jgi:NAD+ synthase (glutamine-hydrolysing)
MRLITVATCNLNQWALDFEGNLGRTVQSIREAKAAGATYRIGSELELSGYGCEDHFLEPDTFEHSWECLADILTSDVTDGILCDIGMPVMHNGVRYNCRVFVFNRQILLVRPKMFLAQDGNYREMRYFACWTRGYSTETMILPECVSVVTGQTQTSFGCAVLQFADVSFGVETCEELFTPDSPHIALALDGVEIIGNGSGSHHQLRKLDTRLDLICAAMAKCGGVYLYANQRGCDGGRLYYDGSSMIVVNGHVVAQAPQFSLKELEVAIATVDLDSVTAYRNGSASRGFQAAERKPLLRIHVDQRLTIGKKAMFGKTRITEPIQVTYLLPEEEIAFGPACWLWDYLRRCGVAGYFLPLSGGADSSSTAAIVGCMCQLVVKECIMGTESVLRDVRRIIKAGDDYVPVDPRELAGRIFHTVYWGTENSSAETRARARKLSEEIGAYHMSVSIDTIIASILAFFFAVTGRTPRFQSAGGSLQEDLALQNIQARVRMVLSYFFAQLLPWFRGRDGSLLVLGSANVDEGLRGYLTKYDCSSADVNPIGAISKVDIRRFLRWAGPNLGYPSLVEVEEAPPTAELRPITSTYVQTDEEDMGMSYADLSLYGRLRKIGKCGPVSMFRALAAQWTTVPAAKVAEKVKFFFRCYAINRHKMTTLTPSYHAESYSPEDNRFDLRQFLYNIRFPWQFKKMHEEAAMIDLERGKEA